jgi:hypothetical protein
MVILPLSVLSRKQNKTTCFFKSQGMSVKDHGVILVLFDYTSDYCVYDSAFV